MQKLGFIGLGKMGALMAARLVGAGHTLCVFDTNEKAVSALSDKGATVAESARDLANKSNIVFASLPTPDVVRSVAFGDDGIGPDVAGKYFIDLSTTGPRVAKVVAQGLARRGMIAIDCPVSGGMVGAQSGKLALMVSCPRQAFEQVQDLLAILGRPTFVSESPGAAQSLKLANNLLAACALAISSEAFVFGVKSGLDPQIMSDVFNQSSGRNTATVDKFPRSVFTGTFDFGFSTGLAYKDVRLCLDEADALGIPTPVGNAVREILKITQSLFGADSDFTSVIRPYEQWANAEVRAVAGKGS
ncbi:NAD(P)-dependent oxidoreductase [Nitratireductor alexandrii]|uniref:NAD(P)-dependent oxidoreductase n=1 Tax=Nitratireductor alexandrii TaxID=2448161 RepID=UPI001EE7FC97|nr:NAD(P)-dependent oxidoreductase [Nitratireductor alexandrii]